MLDKKLFVLVVLIAIGFIVISNGINNTSIAYCDSQEKCDTCKGKGYLRCDSCNGYGYTDSCKGCNGRGYTGYGAYKNRCYWCNGHGVKFCAVCRGWGETTCDSCNGTGRK